MCDVEIDECESNPCMHGLCEDKLNAYECFCDQGWIGTNCDQPQVNCNNGIYNANS